MKNKSLKILLGVVLALIIGYLLGPKMPDPEFDTTLPVFTGEPGEAEEMILRDEKAVGNIRPENESRVIWSNDSTMEKTEYCLLYLHGFSASGMEGSPVHQNFANHFGMNAYIPRLAEHGLETDDALLNMSPDRLWESVKQALVYSLAIGNKVIVMGTSTGGTLALKLAAEYPEYIAGMYLYSPNIRIYNKIAVILSRPWGLQISRILAGGKVRYLEEDPETDAYWYNKYRAEGVVYLQQLIDFTMEEDLFQKVNVPVFAGYYYKDEENQDKTISVEAIHWMYESLGTAEELKREMAFPEAGDHVIACDLTSGSWREVQQASIDFARDILKIRTK